MRLKIPPTFARTLRSTNAIESMIEICRDSLDQGEAVAGRRDGTALVRSGHGRGRQAVPRGERLPPPPALRKTLDAYVAAGVRGANCTQAVLAEPYVDTSA